MIRNTIIKIVAICVLMLSVGAIASCNHYRATLMDDGYEIDSEFFKENRAGYPRYCEDGSIKYYDVEDEEVERPQEVIRLVKNEEEEAAAFSDFSTAIDYEKEMLVLYFFTSTCPRRCRVKKTGKEGDILHIYLKYEAPPKPFWYDTTIPQQKCFVIKMKKVDCAEIKVHL